MKKGWKEGKKKKGKKRGRKSRKVEGNAWLLGSKEIKGFG